MESQLTSRGFPFSLVHCLSPRMVCFAHGTLMFTHVTSVNTLLDATSSPDCGHQQCQWLCLDAVCTRRSLGKLCIQSEL